MRIAIDPGHGMGNSTAGVFDPGATRRVGTETFAEADIVPSVWAHAEAATGR